MPSMIIDCPSCSRKLRVPDDLLGKPVKCPTCEHTFQATAAPAPATPPPSAPPAPEAGLSPAATSDQPTLTFGPEPQPAPGVEDDLQSCPNCGERIGKDAPRCGFCGEVLEDAEEEDDRPWEEPRRFRGRRDAEPHRGTLILVLGIISLVMFAVCGPVGLPLGIAAWVMGRRDLIKMRQNVMDPEGQGLTQAGWICGIIGTILDSLMLFGCLVYLAFIFTFIGTARRTAPQFAPPVRQVPAPPPQRPGKRAQMEFVPQRFPDYLPRACV